MATEEQHSQDTYFRINLKFSFVFHLTLNEIYRYYSQVGLQGWNYADNKKGVLGSQSLPTVKYIAIIF